MVTIADRVLGGISGTDALACIAAQMSGGAAGAVIANLMSSEPAIAWSPTPAAEAGCGPQELSPPSPQKEGA